jgi:hypothetical protein
MQQFLLVKQAEIGYDSAKYLLFIEYYGFFIFSTLFNKQIQKLYLLLPILKRLVSYAIVQTEKVWRETA